MRLSFALSDWKRLGEKYPPALVSLKTIRDEGAAALAAGTATREIFHDVSSINREIGEDGLTVAIFKRLHSDHPELAKKCFRVAQDTLIEKGEIDLFLHYAGDLTRVTIYLTHLADEVECRHERRTTPPRNTARSY